MERLPYELVKEIGKYVDVCRHAIEASKIFKPFCDLYRSIDIDVRTTSELSKLKYVKKYYPNIAIICLRFRNTVIDSLPELVECDVPIGIRMIKNLNIQEHICKSFNSIKYCSIEAKPSDIYKPLLSKIEILNIYCLLNTQQDLDDLARIEWVDNLNYVEIFWNGEVRNATLDLSNIPANTKHLIVNNPNFQTIQSPNKSIDGVQVWEQFYTRALPADKVVVYANEEFPLFYLDNIKEIYISGNILTNFVRVRLQIQSYQRAGIKVWFYGMNRDTCQFARLLGTLMPDIPILKMKSCAYDQNIKYLHEVYTQDLNILNTLSDYKIPLKNFEHTDLDMEESFHQVLCNKPIITLLHPTHTVKRQCI
jgi:hypothetical protein